MTEVNTKLMQQQVKTLLASLADKDIRRIVDRYLEATGEKLEKSCHEISYKCYEASSAVRNRRANGFGRNENQAIYNSIKNLLELLMEDQRSVEIIKECIKRNNESVSTEEDKQNIVKIQLDMSKYERKTGGGGKSGQPLSNNSTYMNMSINEDLSRSKSRLKNGIENLSISALKLTQPSITLQKTQSNIERGTGLPYSYEDQLKKAKAHILQLEAKLKSVLDENAMLKIQVQKADALSKQPRKQLTPSTLNFGYDKLRSTSVEGYKSNLLANTSITGDLNCSGLNGSMIEQKKKSKVPRLKLEILPNYHGKSNKCINQTLLAAYQEKHAAKKS